MSVTFSTEEELRNLIYDNEYLAVKYHNDNFPICQELYKVFHNLSEDERYSKILFVRINADENRIAQKLIEKNVYSFMAIYKKGFLVESRTIANAKDIKDALEKILEIMD